jgi:hypothetical protein
VNQELAQKFFAHVKEQAAGLMSDENCTWMGVQDNASKKPK